MEVNKLIKSDDNERLKRELLKEKLDFMGVPGSSYSINSVEYPNEAYVLFYNGAEWEVYYSEKGEKRGLKKFVKEADACKHFLNQMVREVVR